MINLQTLHTGDSERIERIMSDAFDDDPLQRWVFGTTFNPGIYFGQAAKALYLKKGDCFATEDDKAALLMLRSNIGRHIPIHKMLPLLYPILKHGGIGALSRALVADAIVSAHIPKQPHYYLFAIGTMKLARGRGYGSLLMHKCIELAEAEAMPIYLENSKPENLAFYRRWGFEVIEEVFIGKGSPPMWLMMRPSLKNVSH